MKNKFLEYFATFQTRQLCVPDAERRGALGQIDLDAASGAPCLAPDPPGATVTPQRVPFHPKLPEGSQWRRRSLQGERFQTAGLQVQVLEAPHPGEGVGREFCGRGI